MKLTSVCMLILMQLLVSCSFSINIYDGFLAIVSVDTRGYNEEYVAITKRELVDYVESLGWRKRRPPINLPGVLPPKFVTYGHPQFTLVFYQLRLKDSYNIYILIRDDLRMFFESEVFREEVDEFLEFLREKFGEDNVTFEQQSPS